MALDFRLMSRDQPYNVGQALASGFADAQAAAAQQEAAAAKQADDMDAQEQALIEGAALEWAANPTKDNMMRSVRMLEGRVRPEKLMPMYQRAMTASESDLPGIAQGIIARYTQSGQKQLAERAFATPTDPAVAALDRRKTEAEIDKLRSEAEKNRRVDAGGGAGKADPEWKYDAASDEWVQPPTQEFPMGRRSGSVSKAGAQKSLNYVISQFRGEDKKGPLYKTAQGGPMGILGAIGKVTDSQDQKRFNNLKEQLSTELRTLFRIPGEGALSDREQAQYGIQLPDVSNSLETNEAILDDIKARVDARLEGANPLLQQQAAPRGSLNDTDRQALDWAMKNQSDPRAAMIMQRLGVR